MQSCFTVAILVLQAEGLVSSSSGCVGFALQFAPTIIIPKPDCRPYRQSRVGCRFGRSGRSGFASGFRLRHWCGCVLAPKVRSCRDRYRYRYICRPSQYVGNDGLVFAVGETAQFFCHRVRKRRSNRRSRRSRSAPVPYH